ncbi:hypothetical protein [Nostoc sp. C052]|nr:hypothetical protein [Nostoc sp. C052]
MNEKLHPPEDGVFGHGEEVTNAQYPKRRGDYPSPRHLRDGVSRRFQ